MREGAPLYLTKITAAAAAMKSQRTTVAASSAYATRRELHVRRLESEEYIKDREGRRGPEVE